MKRTDETFVGDRKTVVALEEITVEPPLVDGARASISRHGIFSNVAAAMKAPAWIWEKKPSPGVRYFSIDEYPLNDAYGSDRSLILDGSTRKPRGLARWDDQPWNGLPRCTNLKPGQLVGFVSAAKYRVGVVLALPLGPEGARRMKWPQGCDNVVLVGLLGARGSPRSFNHDHVAPALLFPVRHRVPRALRAALRFKYERYRAETLRRGGSAARKVTIVKPPPLTAEQRAVVEGRTTSGFLEGEAARKRLYGEGEG
jgi:hypothetical protein